MSHSGTAVRGNVKKGNLSLCLSTETPHNWPEMTFSPYIRQMLNGEKAYIRKSDEKSDTAYFSRCVTV